ncbi:hypothetical protein HYX17_05460 [Candidatus Woesearchaeota archaeon]|nr:hypothetical protein [Candidatus Woesearchaeota archaeon]
MKVITILRNKEYAFIALISAIAMVLVYPYLQVILNGGFYNYFFWYEVILNQSILNFILYLIFSILFGLVISLNIYNFRNRACSIKGSSGSAGLGSILAVFIPQCGACVSLTTLFLPAAAAGILIRYNSIFNLISIGILLLAVYLVGGFKK